MTKQQLVDGTRFLVRELTTDAGGLLADATNLTEYLDDAMELVVLDLMPYMPEQFLTTELVSLISGTASYTISAEFWMVYKVEHNVTGDVPKEIRIVNPLDFGFMGTTGETEDEPTACYIVGNSLVFPKTPATTRANAVKLYLVRPEATTIATNGPVYMPRPAQRLIIYRAASLIASSLGASTETFDGYYARRFGAVVKVWNQRFMQEPRFVRPSMADRILIDARDKALFDVDGFFG